MDQLNHISDHVQKAHEAVAVNDIARAKYHACNALQGAEAIKNMFMIGLTPIVTEQQLADWYGGCSVALHKIGHSLLATRSYYTAIVFDSEWKSEKHKKVSNVLWRELVYSKAIKELEVNLQEILSLLANMDILAKYAENQKRWNVCVAIDDDINEVHNFLADLKLVPQYIESRPGKIQAMYRVARCLLQLNLHEDARSLCFIILQVCDGQDSEAYGILARSLYATCDYDQALEKNELALKYCKDDSERQNLRYLREVISQNLAIENAFKHPLNVDLASLTEDIGKISDEQTTYPQQNENGLDQGQRNVPNETDPDGKPDISKSETMINQMMDNSIEDTKTSATNVKPDKAICNLLNPSDNPPRIMDGHSNLRKSVLSTDAFENDLITIRSEDCSSSASAKQQNDTSEVKVFDISEEYTKLRISSESTEKHYHKEMTFYQQSCMHHHPSCKNGREVRTESEFDEKIMKCGVQLNQSFENKIFESKKKKPFYTEFLAKEVMLQNLKRNPNKYVKCRLKIEGAHQALCHPETEFAHRIIEISGRSKIGRTFNDDEVVVEILDDPYKQGKCFGKVVGIYNRHRHKGIDHPVFICTVDTKEINLVRPLCKTVPKLYVSNEEFNKTFKSEREKGYKIEVYEYDEKAETFVNPRIYSINPAEKDSYIFLVAFINWDIWSSYPRGVIIKVLPVGNNIESGLMILNFKHEVPTLYEKETIEEVKLSRYEFCEEPSEALLRGRTDLTGLNVFTIDSPESRDLDDALSIEKTTEGYIVGVHIADVSTFVLKDTALDQEALQRGNTFYSGIHRPRHMIPEPISCNFCSILPQKVRLTISVFFHIASNGVPVMMEGSNSSMILKSFVKSRRRLTYSEAQTMIFSREATDDITNDVKSLFALAYKIRKRRLGNAMFAIGLDWEETCNNVSKNETVEAYYLVEEFMIMTNEKIALRLLRSYKHCVPLRCQPPPSQENINTFCKKNDHYADIVLRFQDKLVGNKKQSLFNCLGCDSNIKVKIAKYIWETIKVAPKDARKLFFTDELHPFQLAIINDWLEIQEKAGYKCSGSLQGKGDGEHFDLQKSSYTHFTSPLRRYNDLVVHRLVHAAVFQRTTSPYSKEEIDTICTHLNAVAKRSKAYEKGCSSLKLALELKSKPKMINTYVEDVSDAGVILCSPVLKCVSKQNRRLMFNLLDMGYKPQLFTDPNTSWETVKATWRKRLYSIHVKQINYLSESKRRQELQLNANKGLVLMPLSQWAKLLECAVCERFEDLSRAVRNARVSVTPGLEDVTTECLNPLTILANTMFSLTYSRGQQIQIQMTAAPYKGVLTPRPALYNMTNNVKFCLQHTDDPVSHLFRYATKPTCDKYQDIQTYLDIWIPIIQMESTFGAVDNPESYCLYDVPVHFTSARTGNFSLGLAECEMRNIELSGTYSDDGINYDTDGSTDTYDWLCLKAVIPNISCQSTRKEAKFEVLENVWVGHANVVKVKKTKNAKTSGTLAVEFQLHEKAPTLPKHFHNLRGGYRFSVEILRKTEVDRKSSFSRKPKIQNQRTESFLKELKSAEDSLAAEIALNKHIGALDNNHIRVAMSIKRDLYYDGKVDDNGEACKQLPRNNEKQQEAIDKAMRSRFSLIQGPPGTGKTYTGIKLMYLFDRVNKMLRKEGRPRKQVLFCGPSNKSVDLVASWMLERMQQSYRPNFVRIYSASIEAIDFPIPGRVFPSKKPKTLQTPVGLHPVALHHIIRQKGKKSAEQIKAFDTLFKKNKYAPMPEEVKEYLHLVHEASLEEIKKYDVILCTTAVGANPKVLKATSVYQVIVDEAGMCPEPQCLMPIIATKAEQVVLIGDHKQLRPIILCKEAALLGLETSLFERYANNKHIPFTMLDMQYRMNPQICYFPSHHFYGRKLQTARGLWSRNQRDIWPLVRNRSYPHVFVHVEGEETTLTVSTEEGNEQSKSNAAEIEQVMRIFKYFTDQQFGSIQILSQYNAQCSEIRTQLSQAKVNFNDENVTTVVSSQGGEWDYVVFSTVRSLPEYKIENKPTLGWRMHNLGFITDCNQVNVALTRARKGLVIVGNKNLLSCDKVWQKLIKYYEDNGCIKKTEEFPPPAFRTRKDIMDENITESKRQYGKDKFTRGQPTFYDGPFDIDDSDDDYNQFEEYERSGYSEVGHNGTERKESTDNTADVDDNFDYYDDEYEYDGFDGEEIDENTDTLDEDDGTEQSGMWTTV